MSPCFDEGRCRCNNITADCSSNNGSLTYVPRLPIDVQVFNFSSNNLSHIPDEFFSNVSQVWLLDLCQNGLTSLSPRAFQELQNLTTLLLNGESFFPNLKLLLLQNNMISSIKDPVCLPNLANLSLSFNKFLTFESNTFGNARFPRLEYLALIEMEDKIVGIERFAFNNSQLKFLGLALNYINLSSQTVLHDDAFGGCTGITAFYFDYCVFKAACLLGQAAASFTIAVIIIVLVVFIISVTCFRYRWHLRLVMYEWFHHRGLQEGQLRHFTYDVFVGYAEEDRKWVMQELLPVVEGQWNLRACVHERDFIPGKHIVDNIADCVQDSRKILMVFSPDYARSEWCQFELKYCQCCVMDRDEVLVLVLLHETESRDMTSAMFAVMKTTTYIEWANTVDARDSFWGRLSRALDCVISY
ncbi:toll-like receptor 2 type-2 [Pomacea canaliculata]|uniref:toll-like receptor 2 type-2 n=1 Tax=Pomacea canaliculata TaxID=400727 RepID=UPI000D72B5D9|nr:toll-like receptor 2 type-2 [Pomacea canaliculata]